MKVSICCITYNHGEFISQALNSFLEQDFTDYEIIISDDNSSDGTQAILKEYKNRFPDKIKILLNYKNIGMSPNFIQALNACSGEYIAICEGDDYWIDPSKLNKQVNFLDLNKEFSICWTLAKRHDIEANTWDDTIADNFYRNNKSDTFIEIEKINEAGKYTGRTLTCVFRSDILKQHNLLDFHYFNDMVLFTMALENGKGAILNTFTAVYRVHKSGVFQGASEIRRATIGLGVAVDIISINKVKDINSYTKLWRAVWHLKKLKRNILNNMEASVIENTLSYYRRRTNKVLYLIEFILFPIWTIIHLLMNKLNNQKELFSK